MVNLSIAFDKKREQVSVEVANLQNKMAYIRKYYEYLVYKEASIRNYINDNIKMLETAVKDLGFKLDTENPVLSINCNMYKGGIDTTFEKWVESSEGMAYYDKNHKVTVELNVNWGGRRKPHKYVSYYSGNTSWEPYIQRVHEAEKKVENKTGIRFNVSDRSLQYNKDGQVGLPKISISL